ncbi:Lrp/AsnC family transcriptional regulator [Amycolatopsis rhizosphaerae]|uniref:Lrp/AsnC family transcriptional regulator n=1 Tax=Amycolatopsis rhizosphaerae TaxID=2053003 RepID=A0A558D6H2_9PSEU|nr:Lrp/AsnC family transcriptional regulator [Amycolatopsis rhizosphaerae]TVT56610.1 Lrp/AsnC family transcriptional regulator [Amycolatopsis rhizosphaerae]
MADESTLDEVDLDLVAALQHAPRAPFDVFARALGVSSRTVTRRYARLVDGGLLRVICEVDWSLLAESVPVNVWIRTEPGAAREVAHSLTERPDTTYVGVCSGRADVFCVLHGMTRAATAQAILTELPRIPGVRALRTEWVLRRLASSAAWRLPRLTGEQIEALAEYTITVEGDRKHDFDPLERELATLLRDDARLPYSEIARKLDISESRARRTATALFASGMLRPRAEIEPRHLGYHTEAVLGISCRPHAVRELAGALLSHPATRFLGLTGSSAMLTFDGVFRDEEELADFLTGEIGTHEAVTGIDCSLLLEIAKRYWTAH